MFNPICQEKYFRWYGIVPFMPTVYAQLFHEYIKLIP
jgi:hypothetical protein